MTNTNRVLFPLGRIHIADEAFAALHEAHQSLIDLLIRHQSGDWGDVNDEARAWNERALLTEAQHLRSVYRLTSGKLLKIITDEARSSTSVTRM